MSKYLKIFQLGALYSFRNYKALVGLSLFLVTCLLIFAHIWKVAAAQMPLLHLQPDKLLWYIAFNEWVLIALPDVQDEMAQDLREGRLAYLLPRPISYLGSIFCEHLGILCSHLLVLGIVTFGFTLYFTGKIPFDFHTLLLMFGFSFGAGALSLLFQMIIGLSAFWFHQIEPFYWIWEKLLFTFGGLMLPLIVYPLWLQKIAGFTPFPILLGERSALVLENSGKQFLFLTENLLLWGLFAGGLLLFLYRRGLRILNIEGG